MTRKMQRPKLLTYFYLQTLLLTIVVAQFTVKIERVEIPFFNRKYYRTFHVHTGLVNRTVRAVWGNAIMIKQLDKHQSKVHASAAQFLSNEYRQGAIEYTGSLYNVMQLRPLMNIVNKYCNPKIAWPVRLNVNYTCGRWVPVTSDFVNVQFPSGRWRVMLNATDAGEKIVDGVVYASVEETTAW